MKGFMLGSLHGGLCKIDDESSSQPVTTIGNVKGRFAFCKRYLEYEFNNFSFEKDYHRLPLGALWNFSFNELCKLFYSTTITVDESVGKLFETRPSYEVVRKIKSSMWRWKFGRGSWNEVVDAYEGIRHFALGLDPDFDVRLDYTTGYNEMGRSKCSRTYLDGVFAFLVYYKRKHVLTIGFSVIEGRRILIQQVQLKQRSGNRWLYRFPENRLEFVIGLFRKHFPTHGLLVIDGKSLVKKTIANYQSQIDRVRERIERDRKWLENREAKDTDGYYERSIQKAEEEIRISKEKIAHLKSDTKRLANFYANTGQYALDGSLTVNNTVHHHIQTASAQVAERVAA